MSRLSAEFRLFCLFKQKSLTRKAKTAQLFRRGFTVKLRPSAMVNYLCVHAQLKRAVVTAIRCQSRMRIAHFA
jgi:hypothetical protein